MLITRSTTCNDLFEPHEILCTCYNCQPKLDTLSFSRKRNKSDSTSRHDCKNYWETHNAENVQQHTELFHKQVREHLNLTKGVECSEEYVHVKSNKNESTKEKEELTKDKLVHSPILEINMSDPINPKPFNENDSSSSKKSLCSLSTSTTNNSSKSKEKRKHVSIKMSDHERCKHWKAIVNRIEDMTHNQECFSWYTSKISRTLISLEMMFAHKILYVSATNFCILILHSFLHQIGVKVNIESLTKISA